MDVGIFMPQLVAKLGLANNLAMPYNFLKAAGYEAN
jgi:hypothetical protein